MIKIWLACIVLWYLPCGIEANSSQCLMRTCSPGTFLTKIQSVLSGANGCGPEDIASIPKVLLVDSGLHDCCYVHDVCYENCRSLKTQCDEKFKRCLHQVCGRHHNWSYYGCEAFAETFVMAVQRFGCEAFTNAQARYCDCISSK